jgi:hypothetical protein
MPVFERPRGSGPAARNAGSAALEAWHVTLHAEVQSPRDPSQIVAHLRRRLYDHLVDRLVTTPGPRLYSLVLYVMAESADTAATRAGDLLGDAVGEMAPGGLIIWRIHPAPTRP